MNFRPRCVLSNTIAAAVATAGMLPQNSGAASVQTLVTNGPSPNRIDIVLLSEGYTTNQLPKFLSDATNAVNGLLNRSPFAEYRRHFNVSAISVASNQSGSDHPARSVLRDTYFNTSYDAADYIITMPTNNLGQGKVDALVQSLAPQADLKVVLINDSVTGGSDGYGKAAIAATASGFTDILAHELGHLLGGLGDEYSTPYAGFPDVEQLNTTRETNRAAIKWNAWIAAETPIPTPPSFEFMDSVGLFEGAHYHQTGWFRPKFDCKMNHPTVPDFCEVCREALTLAILTGARPIETTLPPSGAIYWTNGSLAFELNVLEPFDHNLEITWLTNGVVCATGVTALRLAPGALAAGTNSLVAQVRDQTPFVRSDPSGLTVQNATWNIDNRPVTIAIDSASMTASGSFIFHVTGYSPGGVATEESSNLSGWFPTQTNRLVNGQMWVTNSVAGGAERAFYRVRTLQ